MRWWVAWATINLVASNGDAGTRSTSPLSDQIKLYSQVLDETLLECAEESIQTLFGQLNGGADKQNAIGCVASLRASLSAVVYHRLCVSASLALLLVCAAPCMHHSACVYESLSIEPVHGWQVWMAAFRPPRISASSTICYNPADRAVHAAGQLLWCVIESYCIDRG